jgi:hydrogenase nickel incorporation protein HypA/HybF
MLARQILDAVLERARATNARRIITVRGWVAAEEALVPASLEFHFKAHARGTIAEGARLELRLLRRSARCTTCGTHYEPEHRLLLCPRCGNTEGRLLGPAGVGLESMDIGE